MRFTASMCSFITVRQQAKKLFTRMMSIDMRSDTVTQPTQEMRTAMANAAVGDDVYGEDPTVNRLQAKIATILGKEAALYFPSGTMANLAGIMVHASRRGDEIIIGDRSHISQWEQGGVAQIGGVFPRQVRNLPDGTLDLEELQSKIYDGGRDGHRGHTRLVCLENTQNYWGGVPLPLDYMDKLFAIMSKHDIKIHVDGARLFNAATACNVAPSRLVEHADSVSVCLSKGLCAPVGSLLAGSRDFIDQAHRIRKSLGGGMRQAGVLAAAGIVALDTVVPRLEMDHRNARLFAELVSKVSDCGVRVDMGQVQSNMVLLRFKDARLAPGQMIERLRDPIDPATVPVVKVDATDDKTIRIVTHQQITEEHVKVAAARVIAVLLQE